VRVRIAFEKLDPRILPDMGVKVSFLTEPAPEKADTPERPRLLVPKAAVRTEDSATIVFVVSNGRAERRAIKAGAADGGQVEIASGLTAGEKVVIEGADKLADGTLVKER
jgi:hypothetical protein